MCQKKPGNRCSSHARAELEKYENAYKLAQKEGNPVATQLVGYKYAEARENYDATPEGQEKLRASYQEAMFHDEFRAAGVFKDRLEHGKRLRERRSNANAVMENIESHVQEFAESKKSRDYRKGQRHGAAVSTDQHGNSNDEGRQRQYQNVENKRERIAQEITLMRDEISRKVDNGTIGNRDWRRLQKALVTSARYQNMANGSRSETGSYSKA